MKRNYIMSGLILAFVILMSLPFLVPHAGVLALFGLVPLLCMERIGTMSGKKRMWLWHYSAFLLWNAATTFWVCNATVGGGIFACMANAFQMSLIFGMFRWSRRVLKGALPYIFLVVLWIAWEKYYLAWAQISWPWLVLGNAFARTVSLAQWYEYLGTLGGSLWVWSCNLGLFGIMTALSDGRWSMLNAKARTAAIAGYVLILVAPASVSWTIYRSYEETCDPVEFVALQPDIDPYSKFQKLSQEQQNAILASQLVKAVSGRGSADGMLIVVAPETFTNDVDAGNFMFGRTVRRFRSILKDYPGVNLIFGASSHETVISDHAPSHTARKISDSIWAESHNSALVMDGTGHGQIYHKSKLVVGVEMTPYPAFFCKVDDLLGGVMGRCVGQKVVSLLDCVQRDTAGHVTRTVPVGCAICYESVYPEHCAEYVKAGASLLTVITNDAWWGDTPGYRQHLSYASLRAIETRRDIVRSANTGISAYINQRGDIFQKTGWWTQEILHGYANLNEQVTFFVSQGDIVGRLCVFLAILLSLATAVRIKVKNDE